MNVAQSEGVAMTGRSSGPLEVWWKGNDNIIFASALHCPIDISCMSVTLVCGDQLFMFHHMVHFGSQTFECAAVCMDHIGYENTHLTKYVAYIACLHVWYMHIK